MTFFMADGFLAGRIIEPELREELYTTMVGVFLRGLQALAEDRAGQALAGDRAGQAVAGDRAGQE